MKIMKSLIGVGGIVAICAAIWAWDPLPKNPDADQLAVGADLYSVEIIRDDYGVPHIYGVTDADTSFGLGYAHAEDDFETIQTTVAATRGVLARYQGKGAAVTDYMVALMSVWETLENDYDTKVPADVKTIALAYAEALNLYAAQNPDATWQGLAPFTEQDVLAGFMFKTPLFYGLDGTLLKLFGDERQVELALDPSDKRRAWHAAPKSLVERGSNAIAVAPQRSGDGVTRLLINSHQPMTGPVAWYEAHVVSEQGWDMTGGLFPGMPVLAQGFNDHIGWANTVSEQDLADVYALTINPKNKNQYKLDQAWVDFEQSSVTIRVKLFGPFAFKAKRKIRRSQHGPVIDAPHGQYAIRYAGQNEIGQLEQYYRLNRSENLEQFMNAMSINALPSINYVYGDKQGNIGFIHNGQYPDRIAGWDWQKYLPGDRSELIWQDYLPFANVPKLFNPSSGLIFNANNAPYNATDGKDNLKPDDFASSMGLQTNQTNRSLRLIELTDGVSTMNREALLKLKFDNAYANDSQTGKIVAAVLAYDWRNEPDMAKAAEHLRGWNMEMAADNRHAALGGLTAMKAVMEKFTHVKAPEPTDAFRFAVNYLTTHYGRIDPEWGEVNRLVRGNINLPIDGAPDVLRAIYPAEIRDDGKLHANAGDTWIALVEWAEDGQMSADVVHQYGSATLDESSPHYSDQAEIFVNREWRRALRTRAEIEAHATRTYRPQKP
jgi:penicillin amidase/acyl-homoserine-lactone acylase